MWFTQFSFFRAKQAVMLICLIFSSLFPYVWLNHPRCTSYTEKGIFRGYIELPDQIFWYIKQEKDCCIRYSDTERLDMKKELTLFDVRTVQVFYK